MRIVADTFILRCWDEDAAHQLKEAVESSLPELRRWMDWAVNYPTDLETISRRLAQRKEDFIQGRDFLYLVFDSAEEVVLGSTGLHPRREPGALEIGYWIRTSHAGRGLATGVARALTRTAFKDVEAHRVEIRCDPANTASAAIPRRLGYRLREVLKDDALTPDGRPRHTMVWEITANEFPDAGPVPLRQ